MNPVTIPTVLDRKRVIELRRAARRLSAATEERNTLVKRASAEGGSLREIAEAVGLSHVGVKKILDR